MYTIVFYKYYIVIHIYIAINWWVYDLFHYKSNGNPLIKLEVLSKDLSKTIPDSSDVFDSVSDSSRSSSKLILLRCWSSSSVTCSSSGTASCSCTGGLLSRRRWYMEFKDSVPTKKSPQRACNSHALLQQYPFLKQKTLNKRLHKHYLHILLSFTFFVPFSFFYDYAKKIYEMTFIENLFFSILFLYV